MENLVFYRKYRPQVFKEVVGQRHVVQTLINAVSSGMISHAYLFAGPRGSGKTTIARLLAKAVNCEFRKEGEAEPCNRCLACKEINEGRAIDLIEIDAASNRGIDEIRELKEGIRFAPTRLKYKVFIIDEAHQLSKDAANALLKTLEEPPSHAIFILATTEIHKMIPTIISRCQRFDFKKLTLEEIVQKLEWIVKKEKIKIEKEALQLIGLNCEGSVRDAEAILDQVFTFLGDRKEGVIKKEDVKEILGIVDTSVISEFVDYIIERKEKEAIEFLEKIWERGKDPYQFIKKLVEYLREGLILKINPDLKNSLLSHLTKEEQEKIKSQVDKIDERLLRYSLKVFLEAENKMKYSPIPQLPLELATIEVLKKIF